MVHRRDFIAQMGMSGAFLSTAGLGSTFSDSSIQKTYETFYDKIKDLPFDDTHCHPISARDAQTTPKEFLRRLSLTAFPLPSYFPTGVFDQWLNGNEQVKRGLDAKYKVQETYDRVVEQYATTIFVKYMVKELAGYFDCEPRLEAVIEARNDAGKDYDGYMKNLLKDVNAANLMMDTGYREGMNREEIDRFVKAVKPAKVRSILRVDPIEVELLKEDISFEELETRFLKTVREGLDGTGNFGLKSYGMKSYLVPKLGLLKPVYDRSLAQKSWEFYKKDRKTVYTDREEDKARGKDLRLYLHTLAVEECLEREMPMQFHAGDGEAPSVILRNQNPYFLEEMVRLDKNGVMRQPKIIPLHAGYPMVGHAAWISHLYPNCYFDLSLMTPLIHQGLLTRYLEVMESVPLSKILFASDAYHLPEFYWLTGKWGKKYLSQALTVHMAGGTLTEEEALETAKMILYKNNRAAYNITD